MPDLSGEQNGKSSLAIDFVVPGTVINSPVFNKKGKKLLEPKTPFTEEFIKKLKDSGLERIYFLQPLNQQEMNDRIHREAGTSLAINTTILTDRVYSLANVIWNGIYQSAKSKEFLQTTAVHQLVDNLLRDITPGNPFDRDLICTKKRAPQPYQHALRVMVLSMQIGLKHGFERSVAKQLGLGAFLHDIGKAIIPERLFEKTEPFTPKEQEVINKHPVFGFEMIKLNGQLSSLVRKMVLFHHETTDNKGYPLKLSEKEVGYYPYIVSLANIFDNLTSPGPGREALSVREALKRIMDRSGAELPAYLVQFFVKHASTVLDEQDARSRFERGDFVLLSTGEVALITDTSDRQQVKINLVRNNQGQYMREPRPLIITETSPQQVVKVFSNGIKNELSLRYTVDGEINIQ